MNEGGSLCLSHVLHLYEIVERKQLGKLMEFLLYDHEYREDPSNEAVQQYIAECPHHVHIEYHAQLSELQEQQVEQICEQFTS